ncbi:MAG: hypothetical protein Ta2B_13500 [Termitinemataceae bacterium]|nr:MAG: hypothetical protein Ta2B_13500 [Termitinemataceae bacterium]
MLGLPKATEMSRQLPKKVVFEKFKPTLLERQRFDTDIKRLTIVSEISPATINIPVGDTVNAFYVVQVFLRSAACDKKNLALLSKLIEQNMLFVLEHDSLARLAVFRAGKVLESGEKSLGEWEIKLSGLNLNSVWDNIIIQIGGVTVAEGNTLDEQIAADEERAKLNRRIEQIDKQARLEKQPRRKWELVEEVKRMKSITGGGN